MLMDFLMEMSLLCRGEKARRSRSSMEAFLLFTNRQYYYYCAVTANTSLVMSRRNNFHGFAPRRSQHGTEFRIYS